ASRYYAAPFSRAAGAIGSASIASLYLAVALWIVTDTYRRSDAISRRQIRWILLGAYAAAAPPLVVGALAAWDASYQSAVAVAASSLALIPLSQLIGISRFNFFDVDHLISQTASFSILAVVLLAILVGGVSSLTPPLARATGLGPPVLQAAMAVGLLALLRPAGRRLRPQVDRHFFPERFALERGGERLLEDLSGCADAKSLLELVWTRLEQLIAPLSISIFIRLGARFEPILARGSPLPEPWNVDDPLIASLEHVHFPITASTRSERVRLSPFPRAVMETLGVPCLVPIRRADHLFAFLCLGPKRSCDVYTSTDHALLAGLCQRISGELDRFDRDEVLRASQAAAERLRHYVGAPLSSRIDRGESPDVGAREVSVLFLDLRGYSVYAEALPPDRVFSTVNRYTLAVSEVIARHAGTLVAFEGDGMMAVFGAPDALARKERAAVVAGGEIVGAVAKLAVDEPGLSSVGVGIATGDAFVGSVRSSDRMFWTAVGNTTNRAARLQALTRELNASVVVDEATYDRSERAIAGFERHEGVAIRGHSRLETVYALPLRGT
ncbi:MAG TPA: adenylate/guanylate cyclase domain-containing protein, partial [Myxococcota bacterium]|nr:adenylate/guanylate cyclase domain-containing protein [Myxococcota bacterium]